MEPLACRVYKYLIDDYRCTIEMPTGSVVLAVQLQNGEPHIWAMHRDDHVGYEDRTFIVVPTGDAFFGDPADYIGTWQELNGQLVWHLFEERDIG